MRREVSPKALHKQINVRTGKAPVQTFAKLASLMKCKSSPFFFPISALFLFCQQGFCACLLFMLSDPAGGGSGLVFQHRAFAAGSGALMPLFNCHGVLIACPDLVALSEIGAFADKLLAHAQYRFLRGASHWALPFLGLGKS